MPDESAVKPHVTVRAACPEDAARIAAVNAEGVPGVTPFEVRDVGPMLNAATLFLVAEVDRTLAGYLMAYAPRTAYEGEEYRWFNSRGSDFFYVDQIAVSAGARGVGVGRSLYGAAASAARARNLAALVCEINITPPNPESLAFHQRLGFIEIDRLEVRLHDRYVALMRKAL